MLVDIIELEYIDKVRTMEVPGTVPCEKEKINLFQFDEKMVDISNQIFQNISRLEPTDYLLTDKGFK